MAKAGDGNATDYLIWSNLYSAWWMHGGNGFTTDVHAAGLYSRSEALERCLADGWDGTGIPDNLAVSASVMMLAKKACPASRFR